MSIEGLSKSIIALSLTGLPSNAASETIALRCDLDRGYYWEIEIDLDRSLLLVGQGYSSPIVEVSDKWIIASSTAINVLSEFGPPMEAPLADNWVFDRSTGRFWHSTFSFKCSAADGSCVDGGSHFYDTYAGWCASQF